MKQRQLFSKERKTVLLLPDTGEQAGSQGGAPRQQALLFGTTRVQLGMSYSSSTQQ